MFVLARFWGSSSEPEDRDMLLQGTHALRKVEKEVFNSARGFNVGVGRIEGRPG